VETTQASESGVILIKRYANRKLYNTATSRYITLKGIAELIEAGDEVRVIDNETGEDITSVTLSQILVDTERSNRRVPGTVLSDLIQRSGDVLYSALKRRVGDASEGFEELQRNMKKLLSPREIAAGKRPDWVALSTLDIDRLVQRALERVLRALDLPRRSDLEALEQRLDRVLEELGARPHKNAKPPAGAEGSAERTPAFDPSEH
jgi:polyhydroxyalkanoate synthesis repressor PhaR